MTSSEIKEIADQINLNDEVDYIASINNNIDYLTVSARDATTVLTIKNALSKLANSLNTKNTAISALSQYFNDRSKDVATFNTPKVNGPKA